MHNGDHGGLVRIFVGLSCELGGLIIYYQECNNDNPGAAVGLQGYGLLGVIFEYVTG